ncbi:MAG TPA: Fur family transcriptional regulator [Candidatus Binataceae bacterium]|jgi:Fur family ferric uptake transcriptional regulator|nr:Fur family transcriptional regulator [Candidatus Binataceae bacterium]
MAQAEKAGEEIRPTVERRRGRPTADERMLSFHARLRERGLKSTGQRDDIARVFFELRRHISAEELYTEVKKVSPHVGYATIYRTLKLLKECDLLFERHFDEGQARYEVAGEHHHDHFICERCAKIMEFENDELEQLQQAIAGKMGVLLTHHKMELYGLCADCRNRQ